MIPDSIPKQILLHFFLKVPDSQNQKSRKYSRLKDDVLKVYVKLKNCLYF